MTASPVILRTRSPRLRARVACVEGILLGTWLREGLPYAAASFLAGERARSIVAALEGGQGEHDAWLAVRWRLWLARAWLSALCLGAGPLLVWAASASSVVLVMLSTLLAFGASAGVVTLTGWALSVIVERRDER